jgi:HD-GYP domain-containing protein (c-di-GMP phosphodiesterase class II)
MTNIFNSCVGVGPRTLAWGLRTFGGLPAATKAVPNRLGQRKSLVVWREDWWGNRSVSHPLTPVPSNITNREEIEARIASFAPETAREALQVIEEHLTGWGHRVVANYFFRYAATETPGELVYGNVINTSPVRTAHLREAYEHTKLVKIDRKIVNGRIRGAVNDMFHIFKFFKYGVDWTLVKFGLIYGIPRSFVVIPVRDKAGKAIGKVNLGLPYPVLLARDKIAVLEKLAAKIGETKRDSDLSFEEAIDHQQVKKFVGEVKAMSFLWFLPLYLFPGVIAVIQKLVVLLDSFIEKAREKQETITRERVEKQDKIAEERLRSVEGTIRVLAAAIDINESYTGGHCTRVAQICEAIGRHLPDEVWRAEIARTNPEICDRAVIEQEIERRKDQVFNQALPHDLGKISVDPRIIKKDGPLDAAERAEVRTHPQKGADITRPEEADYPEMGLVTEGIYLHHIDWDGRGYPEGTGLKGNKLPLLARMLRAADSTHAIISRTYNKPRPPEYVVSELIRGCGTSFDPIVVRVELERIARTDLVNIDLMTKEVIAAKKSLAEAAVSQRSLLEQLMEKLGRGHSIDLLKKELETAKRAGRLTPESDELFQQILGRFAIKAKTVIAHAELCCKFYDWLSNNKDSAGKNLFDIFSLFSQSPNYGPDTARSFIDNLLAAWREDDQKLLLDLAEDAFKRPFDPEKTTPESIAALNTFFFANFKQL